MFAVSPGASADVLVASGVSVSLGGPPSPGTNCVGVGRRVSVAAALVGVPAALVASGVKVPFGALVAVIGLGGCSNPLFPESEDRSQFAGYDRARDQTVPAYVEDAYGDRRPNLRGRLLTRE